MMCPECNQKMICGFVPDVVIWMPQYKEIKKPIAEYKNIREKNLSLENGFRIGSHRYTGTLQPAYYCSECEIVLIDANEEGISAFSGDC